MSGKGTTRQLTYATSERAPQSELTSASTGQSSRTVVQRGRKKSKRSTSTSSGIAQENEDPLGADEGIPDEDIPGKKEKPKPNNIIRCCPKYIFELADALNDRYIDMINLKGWGTPLKLQLTDALKTPTVKNVAPLINEKGILGLKGLNLNLYELAPRVIGDPNVGDHVRPSLGLPVGHEELINLLKCHGDKARNMTLVNLRALLIEMSKRNDPKEDDYFMCLYMVLVMGLINAPNTTDRANLNYLGTFCTGEEYMLCDHSVDVLVDGVTNWRNQVVSTIQGNMLLPITIVADFAKLDGDDVDPPVPGYPRYAHITQKRLNRLFAANWEELEFRTFADSVYAEPYPPPSGRDVLGAGSSHGSSPQPPAFNLNGHYCQAAKATELVSKLHSADTDFIDSFLKFMNEVVSTSEGDAKEYANRVRITLRSMGKSTGLNTRESISAAFAYISAHKAIFARFADELNKYVSAIKAIDRERTGKAEKCDCCFTYPSVDECVEITCKDLKSLEDGGFLTNSIIELYTLHLQGSHILPELQSSEIHNKYFIMNPLYYDIVMNKNDTTGQLEREAGRLNLKDIPYLFWPVNGHLSTAACQVHKCSKPASSRLY